MPSSVRGNKWGSMRFEDVLHIVRARRTVQRFAPGEVPDEVVQAALEAARWAPAHRCTWPWRFVLPGPKTRRDLFEIGLAMQVEAKGGSSEALRRAVEAKLLHPDRLVVVVQRLAEDPVVREEDYASCAAAIQNAMLVVAAAGFGSKWGTGALTREPRALDLLGVDVDRERVVGFLWIGRVEVSPGAPPRPSLETLVRHLP